MRDTVGTIEPTVADTFAPMNDPTIGIGSTHPGGFNAVFADGSVYFVKSTPTNPLSLQVLQGMVTRNGGEMFKVP